MKQMHMHRGTPCDHEGLSTSMDALVLGSAMQMRTGVCVPLCVCRCSAVLAESVYADVCDAAIGHSDQGEQAARAHSAVCNGSGT
jgi:hypothetical protein